MTESRRLTPGDIVLKKLLWYIMVRDLSRNSALDYCERFSFLMLYVEKVVYKRMAYRRVRIPMFVSLVLARTTGRECLLYICKYKQIIAQHGENFNGIIACYI